MKHFGRCATADHLACPRLWTLGFGDIQKRADHVRYGTAAVADLERVGVVARAVTRRTRRIGARQEQQLDQMPSGRNRRRSAAHQARDRAPACSPRAGPGSSRRRGPAHDVIGRARRRREHGHRGRARHAGRRGQRLGDRRRPGGGRRRRIDRRAGDARGRGPRPAQPHRAVPRGVPRRVTSMTWRGRGESANRELAPWHCAGGYCDYYPAAPDYPGRCGWPRAAAWSPDGQWIAFLRSQTAKV